MYRVHKVISCSGFTAACSCYKMSGEARFFSTVILLAHFSQCLTAPEHGFTFGLVQGVDKIAEGSTSSLYYAYYGIPFAEPPIGDLRFKAPVRFRGTGPNNVITTDTVRTACQQPTFRPGFTMSEDCLYLNVYVPTGASQATQPKKVLVYIHGGGFISGDTYRYVPSRMVTERDVIVVTTNYRLGVFGFLSSGEGDGNYGLLDQLAAVNWVRENIGTFGGDPTDITVFGNSAGAVCTSLLSLSPKAKGVFSKVILQSGTALNSRVFKDDPAGQFDKLAKATGCAPWFYSPWLRSRFLDSITSCLRRLSTQELFSASFSLGGGRGSGGTARYGQGFGTDSDVIYSPAIDGDLIPKDPALLLADSRYLREAGVLDRSYIVGVNNNEGLLFAELFFNSGGEVSSINNADNAEAHLADVLADKFQFSVPREFEAVATYEYLYPKTNGQPPLQNVLNIIMDYVFVAPSMQFVRALTAADNQTKVFQYLLDHQPRLTAAVDLGISGTSHAMELAYLFDSNAWLQQYNYYTTVPDPSGSDSAIFEAMQGAWTEFAKTGSPSVQSSPWPSYDRKDEFYLSISTSPAVRQHLYPKRMALWTELFMTPRAFTAGRRN